jgi:imidazolonepropionase
MLIPTLSSQGWRHEEYAMRSEGRSYLEIAEKGGGILSTVRATRNASRLRNSKKARSREFLDLMLASGTTTAETKSGYGLNFRRRGQAAEV